MKRWTVIWMLGLAAVAVQTEEIMVSWESNGILVATGMEQGSTCTVEWVSCLTNTFTNADANIVFNDQVADSNGIVRLAVPMFYRVRGVSNSHVSPDTYLVIDLSGGSAATEYPVSYLAELPDPVSCEYKTSKLALRRIPAGSFIMGSPTNEIGRSWNEMQHAVTLTEDFYIGVFEITQRQWELVMGTTPAYYAGDERPVEDVDYADLRGPMLGAGWPDSGSVDASSFVGKLRSRTGLVVDLPTESQWEYACRAGAAKAYNDYTKNEGAGSDCLTTECEIDTNLEPLAWYQNQWPPDGQYHRVVGLKQANAWGLYDMHGNVWESCLDWYDGIYAGNVSDPVGATNGTDRVVRGGSYYNHAMFQRSAQRNYVPPSGDNSSDVGFRVAVHE